MYTIQPTKTLTYCITLKKPKRQFAQMDMLHNRTSCKNRDTKTKLLASQIHNLENGDLLHRTFCKLCIHKNKQDTSLLHCIILQKPRHNFHNSDFFHRTLSTRSLLSTTFLHDHTETKNEILIPSTVSPYINKKRFT